VKAVECPNCESPKAKSLYLLKGADVVECHHCSLIYVPTYTPEFTSMYKGDVVTDGQQEVGFYSYRSELSSHLKTYSARLEEAEKALGRTGRLLDVGCALGHLGEAARRRGWDVYITDVSDLAVVESREHFGLNGFISAPDKLSVKPGAFDLITFYDVIEHLSHPLDLLKDIRKALRPQGLLHLTTPNAKSLSARILGKFWFHLRPNEHLIYFTPETLTTMLQRAGFEVVKIKSVNRVMRVHDILLRLERYSKNASSFLRSLAKRLGVADLQFKVYAGEMQAWARPAIVPMQIAKVTPIHKKTEQSTPVQDILDIVCCSSCKSELQFFEDKEAICTQCELSFEVARGIINFSKYAKRGKRKIVGSS
jgi:2-polyprenyl-3-methyl-5-hydroxy-6-metoxy-1,4-benzoquinol methylase